MKLCVVRESIKILWKGLSETMTIACIVVAIPVAIWFVGEWIRRQVTEALWQALGEGVFMLLLVVGAPVCMFFALVDLYKRAEKRCMELDE